LGLTLGAMTPRVFGSPTGFVFLVLPPHPLIDTLLLLPLPPPFITGIIGLVILWFSFIVLSSTRSSRDVSLQCQGCRLGK
jgi:hypothetical protein